MSLKRKPETADAEVLRFCGALGHQFVTTLANDEGGRRSWMESSSAPTVEILKLHGAYEKSPRTFERSRKGWRRVR